MTEEEPRQTDAHDVPTEKKLRDLLELLEVAKVISIEKDFDRLLDIIVDAACRVMEAERGSLYIYDAEAGDLWTKIAHQTERFRIAVGRGIAGQVAQCREVLNVLNADTDNRHFKGIDEKSGFHTKTVLCGPLINHEGRLIGVLQLLNKKTQPFHFTDYDEQLLQAFTSHIAVTLDQAHLVRQYIEKQRIEQALALAREIQEGLLPKEIPELEGFDLHGWSLPCDETGGDYFDFIEMGEGRLGLVIADVTGHGVGPALLMAEARAFMRASAIQSEGLDRKLFTTNNLLAHDLHGGRFVTCFFGLLEVPERRFSYSSAGHGHPLLYHAHSREFVELESTAPPLGIMRNMEFPMGPTSQLDPGDLLVMTTDGIEEAMNPDAEEFGKARLKETIASAADNSAKDIVKAIRDAVTEFMGDADQRDDLTLVVLKAVS